MYRDTPIHGDTSKMMYHPGSASRLVHATSVFEEGWLIVQAQYYKLEQVRLGAASHQRRTPHSR